MLNRLDNIDKHRLLVTVGSSFGGVDVGPLMRRSLQAQFDNMGQGTTVPKMTLFINPADKLCPLKTGDELYIDAPDAEPYEEFKFRFTVSFNEPGVAKAEPVIESLKHLGDLVSNTILRFRLCLA